ncbi:sulfatase-like hydrolase/transferase [Lentisphaerota bacterium WC36G]|nr:sulfatase-like hydrolase/transferase [Lentisphaerae bacterium WC36]
MSIFSKISTITTGTILLTSVATAVSAVGKKPNILFIFPDQMRRNALGIWSQKGYNNVLPTPGDPVITPNLDKLARQSAIFTRASATFPLCSPYRAMLMTGTYPHENGIEMNCYINRKSGLNLKLTTLTDVLAQNGYDTGYVGKTHWYRNLAEFDNNNNYVGVNNGTQFVNKYDTYIAPGRGRLSNRYWVQTIGDNHFDHYIYSNQPQLVEGKKDGEAKKTHIFSPIHEADAVVAFLKNKNGERSKDKPFSMVWAPNPPHPDYSKPEDTEVEVYNKYFRDRAIKDIFVRKNVDFNGVRGKKIQGVGPVYLSHICSIDREIGRVLDALEESGEAGNTIVVFTSDHGEMLGSHGKLGKGPILNESFYVPFLVRYPKVIKHRIEDLNLTAVDVMPTVLGMVGLGSKIPVTVRGTDFSKGILTNDYSITPKPKDALHIISRQSRGIVTERYTYSVSLKHEPILYDNKNDIWQTKNIYPSGVSKEVLTDIQKRLGDYLNKIDDPWAKKKILNKYIKY